MKIVAVLVVFVILCLMLASLSCDKSKSSSQVAVPLSSDLDPLPTTGFKLEGTKTGQLYEPFTVVGSDGSEVAFEKPPDRIVVIDSSVLEILFAMGEGSRVVGTHSYASYPSQVVNISKVGDAFDINIEDVVVLQPDLVFVFSPTFLEQLKNVDLKVLYIQSLGDNFINIADNMRLWGRIVGNPISAEDMAVDFENRLKSIEEALSHEIGGISIFQDEGGLWSPGSGTLMNEVFNLLKLHNIAFDVSGYGQLSPEVIVDRNPQIIIASYGDTISTNPVFKDIMAVKNSRVYVPSSDALSVAGPRFIEGIEEMAEWVYPGLFE